MISTKTYLLLFLISFEFLSAQRIDSAALISEVQIDAYRKPAKFITSTKSVSIIGTNFLAQNSSDRLLESVNLSPGSKMEERSPGSYRFSIRGSTLRSPFGVRNVKIYLDDFALTDASGNTYLNLIDPEMLGSIEIYKGPESGDFGAATGGTALLKSKNSTEHQFGIAGGSFEHYKGKISTGFDFKNNSFQVYSSYENTNSYRNQAALERKFIFLKNRYSYSENNQVQMILLLSDLHYETPGGLTLEQMNNDPRQARPKTKTLPGAEEQNAGIYNKMIFAGISNIFNINKNLSQFTAIQGNYNDFRNPFITNYEKRFENNFSLRTHLNFEKHFAKSFYQTRLGFEGAVANGRIRNFDNNFGIPGKPQNFDNIKTQNGFLFLSQKIEFGERLFFDLSGSLNFRKYNFESILPEKEKGSIKFKNDFLPNFGISYLFAKGFSVRGKMSKGNSAPTSEEIRSSAQEINTTLFPEFGWNKEIGVRKQWGNVLFTEVSLFDFRLKDAIVRRENEDGNEFFVNAGETVQKGIEFIVESRKFTFKNSFFSSLKFYFAGNFYDFKFKNYKQNETDYSGNKLTGVPSASAQSLINLEFFNKINIDVAHFYNSGSPLNDANSVIAKSDLVGNISLSYPIKSTIFEVDLKLSVQNLYNTKYSLGYDINAFGNRYYNPAAGRNYLLGVYFRLL